MPGVLRTPDGLVIVRQKAMSRPRKAAGLLKSPDCHPSSFDGQEDAEDDEQVVAGEGDASMEARTLD